jgi:hypothetical protein
MSHDKSQEELEESFKVAWSIFWGFLGGALAIGAMHLLSWVFTFLSFLHREFFS